MFNKNKPFLLTTGRYRRNLIIAGVLLIALVAIIGFVLALNAPKDGEGNALPFVPAVKTTPDVVEVQEETETLNTPQEACNFIVSYYKALANKDVKALKDLGAAGAANALSRNWLETINYQIDFSKLEHPDAAAFPPAQGLYAGCALYKINDFYSTSTADAIDSFVYGKQEASGWIYYDPINVKWVIADPTIPTAYAAPAANTVERLSGDKKASVKMVCGGVYANPWWAWAYSDVQLANNSQDIPISISAAKYDNGFTVTVPDSLRNGAAPATADSRTEVAGGCAMWRGNTTGWSIEKIGARALEVEGNICPIVATFGAENISPIFTVGKSDSAEIAQELAEAQIEEFGAVEVEARAEDEDVSDVAVNDDSNTGNETENQNKNQNENKSRSADSDTNNSDSSV